MAIMGSSSNVNYSDLSNMIDEICRRYVQYIHMCSLALYLDRQEFLQCSVSMRVNEAYSIHMSHQYHTLHYSADTTKAFITRSWIH